MWVDVEWEGDEIVGEVCVGVRGDLPVASV